jgi:acetyl esterase
MPATEPVQTTRGDRLQAWLARRLFALPAPVKRLLAGGRPVRADGQTLDVDAQLALAMMARAGRPSFETLSPEAARREITRTARVLGGEPRPVEHVASLGMSGPTGPIPARLYRPETASVRLPLLVYYHGGGWVVGDLDTHDGVCRFLALTAGVCVLSVDYRLAPEHRFPAAVEDACAAFRWAVDHARELGSEPTCIAVGGDSAGGNLAAVVSQIAVREGGPVPAFQLLLYPVTDLSTKHSSYRSFGDGFFLTEAQMDWYRGHYLPDEAAARDPRASPLLAPSLGGLPPAHVVTAGFDPLRDEGEAYAVRLQQASVPTTLRRYAGLVHAFCNMTALAPSAERATTEVALALREALATAEDARQGRARRASPPRATPDPQSSGNS